MKSKDFQQTREATKKKRHTNTYTLKLSADRVFPTVAIVVIHVDDPFFVAHCVYYVYIYTFFLVVIATIQFCCPFEIYRKILELLSF